MHLWQVSLAGDSRSLIGHMSVAFGGAPNFYVADSLDGAFSGPFSLHIYKDILSNIRFSRRCTRSQLYIVTSANCIVCLLKLMSLTSNH